VGFTVSVHPHLDLVANSGVAPFKRKSNKKKSKSRTKKGIWELRY
jgi:hypothetical protein